MSEKNETLIQLDFSEEMKTSYRDYAVSVIIDRALPDVRDGLKPVQRRILYAMNELGLEPKKPHRKSARIVGDTMGKYHPHGDTSIYDALVHLTEPYSLQIPLIDGHGNFGSIDGDGAAAMRYTEARLSEGAMTLLNHLEKGIVDFNPNFDNSEKEPSVLPAMLPNLLINGTTGIAVGMATNIPPHNPAEVIDAVIAYMDKPDITTEQLMHYIPGPDFPTGGIITNASELRSIYETGEGKLRIRAKTEIESGDYGRKNIIITEIPYTCAGNKTKLVENLVALMKDKVFDEIFDVRDESSKEGLRIVIEVKRDRNIPNLLNGLYKKTGLEDTYSVNLLAVKTQQPYTFSLKQLMEEFVIFQKELYTKEYQYLLQKAKERQEIVSGLIRAVDIIDLIIEILRGSSNLKQAKACLIHGDISDIRFRTKSSQKEASKLDFTEQQAEAILSMPLSRLIGLELLKLQDENTALLQHIAEYETILSSQKELYRAIKTQLKTFKKKFSHPRKTELTNAENTAYIVEEKIEDIYVLIDKFGYTKSVDHSAFQRALPENLKEYVHTIKMKNNDKLCLFTMQGTMYQIKASAIPKGKLKEKGVLLQTLCKIGKEDILLYTCGEVLLESELLFTTRNGFIKLVSGIEFETNRSSISSTKLEDDDTLIDITLLSEKEALDEACKVVVLTEKGASLGFLLNEIPEMKKTGRGVKAVTFEKNDMALSFVAVLPSGTETFVWKEKTYYSKKVRLRKRGMTPQKI